MMKVKNFTENTINDEKSTKKKYSFFGNITQQNKFSERNIDKDYDRLTKP